MINNLNPVCELMEFNPEKSYYKFVCLIRWKDFKDNPNKMVLKAKEKQEILVKQWLIDSAESFDKLLTDMTRLTYLVKGRLYMCVDRKSTLKTLVNMQKQTMNYIEPFIYSNNASCSTRAINKIPASCSSLDESSDHNCRKWLFDIDCKSQSLVDYICEYCKDYFPLVFKTINGYHVVVDRKFNPRPLLDTLPDKAFEAGKQMEWLNPDNTCRVEVKENAMTLVYTNLDENYDLGIDWSEA